MANIKAEALAKVSDLKTKAENIQNQASGRQQEMRLKANVNRAQAMLNKPQPRKK